MKTFITIYWKLWNQLMNIRSLCSTSAYSLLLLSILLPPRVYSSELLYLEVYNITLLYIILNMLLFAKDILHPKTDYIFTKEIIETTIIVAFSAILIISLYILKDTTRAITTSNTLIKIQAVLGVSISILFSGKSPSKFSA